MHYINSLTCNLALMRIALFCCSLLLWLLPGTVLAQTIKGTVADIKTRSGLADVAITNIHTATTFVTGSNGAFEIAAGHDELLEFRKQNFKTVRVRISKGYIPPYYMIVMEPGINPLPANSVIANRYDPTHDSLEYYTLFRHELEFARLTPLQSIAHPFSALSSRNREIWKFQDLYQDFEKEKYVDLTFNARLVNKFTGLSGDSLNVYLMRYRPAYEQLRNMSDYAFYAYVKRTVYTFRNGQEYRRNAQ
ncbi:MAG: carboxypeptidase regulatory-like domain-containing protein [Chitinophagia bacterium]|nr:carboxypeptidase regulatory-like domain-containing protein [Chitinophagia bacterium]